MRPLRKKVVVPNRKTKSKINARKPNASTRKLFGVIKPEIVGGIVGGIDLRVKLKYHSREVTSKKRTGEHVTKYSGDTTRRSEILKFKKHLKRAGNYTMDREGVIRDKTGKIMGKDLLGTPREKEYRQLVQKINSWMIESIPRARRTAKK